MTVFHKDEPKAEEKPTHAHGHKEAPAPKATGYYRVTVWHPSVADPPAVGHVAAKDNDEAEGFRQIGIASVDRLAVRVEIAPVEEMAYLEAQAKRWGVHLPSNHDAEGKLTWAPPGHKLSKDYYVSKAGTLSDKKEEEK